MVMGCTRKYCTTIIAFILLTAVLNWISIVYLSPKNRFAFSSLDPVPSSFPECRPFPNERLTVFMVTPSRKEWNQHAHITRLAQTLALVGNIHWILVEDSENKSSTINFLLQKSCNQYTHLAVPTTLESRKVFKSSRGMIQRNAALDYIRNRFAFQSNGSKIYDKETFVLKPSKEVGVVYFGDDDNTYDIQLFKFMRQIKTVGIWGVGLMAGASVEHPRVVNGSVVGWLGNYLGRKFNTDMAGFAINVELFLKYPNASFHSKCGMGSFETCLLSQFKLKLTDLQPFGFDAQDLIAGKRRVYVWHTKSGKKRVKKIFSEFDP